MKRDKPPVVRKKEEEVLVISSREKPLGAVRAVWSHRELLYIMAKRDLSVRYRQAAFGVLWAVFPPLLTATVFSLLIGKRLVEPNLALPYFIYVYSGVLVWNIVANGIQNGVEALISQVSMLKKIYFPRLVIPLAAFLVTLTDFALASLPFILAVAYYLGAAAFFSALLGLLGAALILLFFSIGLSSAFGAWALKYRDFRYALPFFLQLAFFSAPIVYSQEKLLAMEHGYWLGLYPPVGAMALLRGMLSGDLPSAIVILLSLASALIIMFFGVYIFRRMEAYFADIA